MKKELVFIVLGLFLVGLVSAFEITLNSPKDNTEYNSTSVNLDVDFSELVKCNYTLIGTYIDTGGNAQGIFKLIPSNQDNPQKNQTHSKVPQSPQLLLIHDPRINSSHQRIRKSKRSNDTDISNPDTVIKSQYPKRPEKSNKIPQSEKVLTNNHLYTNDAKKKKIKNDFPL